ncbi:phosphatidylinositol-specific phospholipase C domain-containing protein [Micromonospora sp. NPDC049101]|uniref:phosphatidylinositol-specific phospholipase C domain-containing protein n=1 Tax=Micromonospora sp. NPDC049101 TaxID=3155032 RepID=UPI0033C9254F
MPTTHSASAPPGPAKKPILRWPRRSRQPRPAIALLVLTLVATTATAVAGPATPAFANDHYSSIGSAAEANRDWMSRVSDDASLADLSIPGTHDTLALCGHSASQNGSDCEYISTSLTQTQERLGYSAETLATQLDAGIRSIDIRVRVDQGDAGLTFTVHHGVYYQWANFTDVLTKIETFLRANPTETVLLNLKAECLADGTSCADAEGYGNTEWRRKVFDSYLTGRYHTGIGDETRQGKAWDSLFWSDSVDGVEQTTTPTLGAVRGKIVLLGFRGPAGGIYGGYGIGQLYPAGGSYDAYVQDDYDVPQISDIDDKWERVRTQLRKTNGVWDANRGEQTRHDHEPGALYMNFTSGTGGLAHPYTVAGGTPGATGVNEFLIQCLRGGNDRCPEFYPNRAGNFGGRETMDRLGIMMMDFPGGKLIDEIVARNPAGRAGGSRNGGAGDPMEEHAGGDNGGTRPVVPTDHAQCRPDGMIPTAGTATPYCRVYQGDGREWLGQGRSRRVIGYFNGSRTGADGKPSYLVKNMPWSKLTHINYAFARVENNRISVGADGPNNPATGMTWNVPGTEMDQSLPYRGHFNLLTTYKRQHPRVKTLISVGGWAESRGFYGMTTNADGTTNQAGINTFSDSVVDFLGRYGFDGVDIDFEYPTVLDDTGNPNDWNDARSRRKGLPTSYTALMKTLREKLDRASATNGRYYLLTSATSASGYLVRGMENQKALRYQDYTNLMAYDYHGSWNEVVGPNAALHDDGKDPELSDLYSTPEYQKIGYFNTDWAFHHLRGAMQAGRINIGIPYYTRGWRNVTGGSNGMWGRSVGSNCQPGTGLVRPCGGGALGIDNIWHDLDANGQEVGAGVNPMWHAKNLERDLTPRYAKSVGLTPDSDPNDRRTGTYDRYWDATTRTAWLWNPEKKTYLSIQDTEGLDQVVDYVNRKGAGGVMMWELSGDYECPAEATPDNPCVMGYTLTNRLHERLQGAAAYGDSRGAGSSVQRPALALDVTVDLIRYPTDTASLWPLTPTVRISNNTGVTIGGGRDNVISFDLPTSTPPLVKDGNWQTGAQGGRWKVQAGHTGPNVGTGLSGAFHRVSLTLDYCQIIPAGQSLDVPIIYYIPATGPVNTTLKLGGTTFASVPEQNRGAAKVIPATGGCSAPAWDAGKIYNPATQSVENISVKYAGKVWQAKWWTQGNVPGTGANADLEPWRLIGPAN